MEQFIYEIEIKNPKAKEVASTVTVNSNFKVDKKILSDIKDILTTTFVPNEPLHDVIPHFKSFNGRDTIVLKKED